MLDKEGAAGPADVAIVGAEDTVAAQIRDGNPGMPSFGWQLNDEQVAAVLTYIRNAWKTAAVPVSADTVGKARDQLRTRSD